MKSVSLFVFILALASARISIKMHSIKSRFVIGLDDILFAGMCVCERVLFSPDILQPGTVKELRVRDVIFKGK